MAVIRVGTFLACGSTDIVKFTTNTNDASYKLVKLVDTSCAVTAISLQRKIQTNVESLTLTAKINAVSENLSFSRQVCVQNEVTDTHKFCRREIWFVRTLSASFSYELHVRKRLN